jgi:hypothetical protein
MEVLSFNAGFLRSVKFPDKLVETCSYAIFDWRFFFGAVMSNNGVDPICIINECPSKVFGKQIKT